MAWIKGVAMEIKKIELRNILEIELLQLVYVIDLQNERKKGIPMFGFETLGRW